MQTSSVSDYKNTSQQLTHAPVRTRTDPRQHRHEVVLAVDAEVRPPQLLKTVRLAPADPRSLDDRPYLLTLRHEPTYSHQFYY